MSEAKARCATRRPRVGGSCPAAPHTRCYAHTSGGWGFGTAFIRTDTPKYLSYVQYVPNNSVRSLFETNATFYQIMALNRYQFGLYYCASSHFLWVVDANKSNVTVDHRTGERGGGTENENRGYLLSLVRTYILRFLSFKL